jgi:hypothetical protein
MLYIETILYNKVAEGVVRGSACQMRRTFVSAIYRLLCFIFPPTHTIVYMRIHPEACPTRPTLLSTPLGLLFVVLDHTSALLTIAG